MQILHPADKARERLLGINEIRLWGIESKKANLLCYANNDVAVVFMIIYVYWRGLTADAADLSHLCFDNESDEDTDNHQLYWIT